MRSPRLVPGLVLLFALAGCAVFGPQPVPSAPEPTTTSPRDRARADRLHDEALRLLNPAPGAAPDTDRAARLIDEAASLGSPDAQMLMAAGYLFRTDLARDPAAAAPWLLRAAGQGHVLAQVQLARLIATGDGVRKEPAWAAVWFQRAAERGSGEGHFALGMMQIAGIGTTQDFNEAWARLTLAEAGGVAEAARYRQALEPRVSRPAAMAALERVRGETARGPVTATDRPLVRFAQVALSEIGYRPGPVDGRDGPATRAALGAFARAEAVSPGTPYAPAVIDRLRLRMPRG